jgi:hypothetical protein
VRVDRLISPAAAAKTLGPTSTFELIGNEVKRILILIVPQCQLVKAAASITAVQVNRRIIGPYALKHHTITSTTHAHIVRDAGAETRSQRIC